MANRAFVRNFIINSEVSTLPHSLGNSCLEHPTEVFQLAFVTGVTPTTGYDFCMESTDSLPDAPLKRATMCGLLAFRE